MIRISRLADYATVIMAYLALHNQQAHNAREIAEKTGLALPTVSKLLKRLAHQQLLISQRGAKGGYQLACAAEKISIAQIIQALDSGVALTDCSHMQGLCAVEKICTLRGSWRNVSQVINSTLQQLTLASMVT